MNAFCVYCILCNSVVSLFSRSLSPPSSSSAVIKLHFLLLCLHLSVIMLVGLLKLDLSSVGLSLFLGLFCLALFEICRIRIYKGRYPPGPTPLPFVGTIPHFLKNPMGFIRSVSLISCYAVVCYLDLTFTSKTMSRPH